jgi:serine protease Do
MSTRLRFLLTATAILLGSCVIASSSYAQNRMTQILSLDNNSGAYLGIGMTDVTEDNRTDYKLNNVWGVIVQTVEEGSPAETGGLKERDVILEFDGIKVRSAIQFQRLVRETPVGRKVELLVSRSGKQVPLTARLDARNESGQAEAQGEFFPYPLDDSRTREFLFRFPNSPGDTRIVPGQRPARLGVTLQPLTDQLAEYLGVPGRKGVLVSSVAEDSPASGKLEAGDVIIQAKSRDIESPQELADILEKETGGSIALKVIRDKKEVRVTINLSSENRKGFKL